MLKIAERGARDGRVFGSVAHGQERGDSDVDLLVAQEPGRSLLDLACLELRLARLLGRPVDVVTEGVQEPIRDAAKAALAADPGLEAAHPSIDWSPVARMRDRVTPHDWAADREVVWATACDAVQALRQAMEAAPAAQRGLGYPGLRYGLTLVFSCAAARAEGCETTDSGPLRQKL